MAKVHILPDRVLPDPLEGAKPPSHGKFCYCDKVKEVLCCVVNLQLFLFGCSLLYFCQCFLTFSIFFFFCSNK